MPDLGPLLTPSRGELANLVCGLHADASPWLPSGLGNHLHWGAAITTGSAVLSLRRHNQLLQHKVGDFTVTVEAGMPLEQLQQQLAAAGQWLPLDPPLAGATSIGGLVARGLSGRLRHRYMSLRDLLIGLQLLRADGTQAKAGGQVVKNVAGYDLMRLFCGSWGSLGLITSVTLRTLPLPPCRLLLRLEGPLAQLQQLRQDLLLRSPLALELLEWRQAADPAASSNNPWLELGLVSLNSNALNAQLEQLRQLLPAAVRQQQLEECSLIAPVVPPDQWLLRLGVTPARIDQLLAQKLCNGWQLRLGAASGLGLAQAAFEATPAHRVEALRRSCEALGGYLTVLQAPSQSSVAAWGDAPARPLIEAVKRQFDPLQQLARGRLPGVAASNH